MKKTICTNKETGPWKFKCFMCGDCCSCYQVNISITEAKTLSDKLGMEWKAFSTKYLDKRWPGKDSFLVVHKNGGCVFLKKSAGSPVAKCTVNDFKPQACLDFSARPERKECQRGLEKYWLLKLNKNGQFMGAPNQIERFLEYANSMDFEEGDVQE